MLASFEEAEDAVQETYLRAWRGRAGFDGASARAWLYRIATNVCIDARRARASRAPAGVEVPWLQPYPDALLDELAGDADEPGAVAVERETIELVFLAALQLLPARQRAALIARDVLGWSATATAGLLETSVPAANSALQRARATLRQRLPGPRSAWSAGSPTAQERELLERFIDAHERCDAEAAATIAAEDIRVTMPPAPMVFAGIGQVGALIARALGPDREGDWRLLPTRANRMPAAASYLLRPGDTLYRPLKLDVLRIEDGRIREITTFGWSRFPAFGLPAALPAGASGEG
jgi:RNA polymerase sigma-70 factor (ECF subfamily)